MNKEELKALEEKIVAQVEKRKAEGWKVVRHQATATHLTDGKCIACALGCFAEPGEQWRPYVRATLYHDIAERALGLTRGQALSFAGGFDGYICESGDHRMHALGQRVAERVL